MWWIIVSAWLSIGGAMALAMRGMTGGTRFFNPWIAYPVIVLLGPIGPILFFMGKM